MTYVARIHIQSSSQVEIVTQEPPSRMWLLPGERWNSKLEHTHTSHRWSLYIIYCFLYFIALNDNYLLLVKITLSESPKNPNQDQERPI